MIRGLGGIAALALLLEAGSALAGGAVTEDVVPPRAAGPSPRRVAYRIDARLDPARRLVTASEVVTYRNDTPESLREIPFHLYPNAFSSDRTLFAREALDEAETEGRGVPALERARREGGWGWMRIQSVALEDGTDLSDSARVDETVMRVSLPVPLAPGAAVSLRIAWETKLPVTVARMGAWGDHFDVMQWYPKPAVREAGAWKAYPYHARSEFFADFATFDVTLTVPGSFRVEATGVPGPERRNPDGSRSVTYRAEDVHDFAWVADPHAKIARERVGGVEIVFFHQPQHEKLVPRVLSTVRDGLRFYAARFIPYPYPRIVVVDLPMGLGGGMEYPMLFTTSMAWFLPGAYIGPESVTAHEFGHQIWYGLVATDEFEEAWLDEGINTYATLRLLQSTVLKPRQGATLPALSWFALVRALGGGIPLNLGFHRFDLADLLGFRRTPFRQNGPTLLGYPLSPFNLNLPGLTTGYQAARRDAYLRNGRADPLETPSWGFYPGDYGATVYSKTLLVLETLEGTLGPAKFAAVLKAYAERYAYAHPRAEDFLSVATEVGGSDLKPLADQLVFGTAAVDFAVESVRSRRREPAVGYLPSPRVGEAPRKSEGGKARGGDYESTVVVRNLGDAVLPVDVLVTFEDGSSVRERWDGVARWRRFTYVRPSRVRSAVIDPERVYQVDLDFNNNSWTRRHQVRAVGKLAAVWLFWLENYLHLASTLF